MITLIDYAWEVKVVIAKRLTALRAEMKKRGIDAYLIPTADFHQSEYVGGYFTCRKYMTGFTGSAGTALIMPEKAILWTDGRYFIQAEKELKGSTVELYKMGEEGVPTISRFLEDYLSEDSCLGFDGRADYKMRSFVHFLADYRHCCQLLYGICGSYYGCKN